MLLFLLAVLACLVVSPLQAQFQLESDPVGYFRGVSHIGKEFYLTFPPSIQLPGDPAPEFKLVMYGAEEQIVTVHSGLSGKKEVRTIPAFELVEWTLSSNEAQVYTHALDVDIRPDSVYANGAVHIVAEKRITVMAVTTIGNRQAKYTAIPREHTQRFVSVLNVPEKQLELPNGITRRLPAHIAYTGLEDSTTLKLTVFGEEGSVTSGGSQLGDTKEVLLHRGDVYLMSTGSLGSNLIGTFVHPDKPVGVTVSGYETFEHSDGQYCDMFFEQLYSHDSRFSQFSYRNSQEDSDSIMTLVASYGHTPPPDRVVDIRDGRRRISSSSYTGATEPYVIASGNEACVALLEKQFYTDSTMSVTMNNLYNSNFNSGPDISTFFTGIGSKNNDFVLCVVTLDKHYHEVFLLLDDLSDTIHEFLAPIELGYDVVEIDTIFSGDIVVTTLRLPAGRFFQAISTGKVQIQYPEESRKLDNVFPEPARLQTNDAIWGEQTHVYINEVHTDEEIVVTARGARHGVVELSDEKFNCVLDSSYLDLAHPRKYYARYKRIRQDAPFGVKVSFTCFNELGNEKTILVSNCKAKVGIGKEPISTSYGSEKVNRYFIRNEGNAGMTIDSIFLWNSEEGFSFVDSTQAYDVWIAPKDSVPLDIRFAGTRAYRDTVFIRVENNCFYDGNLFPLYTKTINSPDRDCNIVLPDSITCELDYYNDYNTRIWIANNGQYPVSVDSMRIVGSSGVVEWPDNWPPSSFTVEPGTTRSRYISFFAEQSVSAYDTLKVYYECGQKNKDIVLVANAAIDCTLGFQNRLEFSASPNIADRHVFSVTNETQREIIIDSLVLGNAHGAFSWKYGFDPNRPQYTWPGSSHDLELVFSAPELGTYTDTLYMYPRCQVEPKKIILHGEVVVSSIHDSDEQNVLVSLTPNPIFDEGTLNLSTTKPANCVVRIIGVDGRVAYEQQVHVNGSTQLTIPKHLPSGLYVAHVSTQCCTAVQQLLIHR